MSVIVTLVVAGAIVPWTAPPLLVAGRVAVEVDTLRRVVTETAVSPDGRIVIRRDDRSCALRIGSPQADCNGQAVRALPVPVNEPPGVYVPLAAVLRGLGADVRYDGRSHTVAVDFPGPVPAPTASPFDPAAPQVTPTRVFTPEPVPTPRATATGSPRPRRTGVPAVPSLPLGTPAPSGYAAPSQSI